MKRPKKDPKLCPGCGRELHSHTCVSDTAPAPSPGDVSVHDGCGAIIRWLDDGTLAVMSEAEISMLPDDLLVHVVKARHVIQLILHTRRQLAARYN